MWRDTGVMTAQDRAQVYTGLGDFDRAIALLEQAYESREHLVIGLTLNPGWQHLQDDPRYLDLLRRLGIDP